MSHSTTPHTQRNRAILRKTQESHEEAFTYDPRDDTFRSGDESIRGICAVVSHNMACSQSIPSAFGFKRLSEGATGLPEHWKDKLRDSVVALAKSMAPDGSAVTFTSQEHDITGIPDLSTSSTVATHQQDVEDRVFAHYPWVVVNSDGEADDIAAIGLMINAVRMRGWPKDVRMLIICGEQTDGVATYEKTLKRIVDYLKPGERIDQIMGADRASMGQLRVVRGGPIKRLRDSSESESERRFGEAAQRCADALADHKGPIKWYENTSFALRAYMTEQSYYEGLLERIACEVRSSEMFVAGGELQLSANPKFDLPSYRRWCEWQDRRGRGDSDSTSARTAPSTLILSSQGSLMGLTDIESREPVRDMSHIRVPRHDQGLTNLLATVKPDTAIMARASIRFNFGLLGRWVSTMYGAATNRLPVDVHVENTDRVEGIFASQPTWTNGFCKPPSKQNREIYKPIFRWRVRTLKSVLKMPYNGSAGDLLGALHELHPRYTSSELQEIWKIAHKDNRLKIFQTHVFDINGHPKMTIGNGMSGSTYLMGDVYPELIGELVASLLDAEADVGGTDPILDDDILVEWSKFCKFLRGRMGDTLKAMRERAENLDIVEYADDFEECIGLLDTGEMTKQARQSGHSCM